MIHLAGGMGCIDRAIEEIRIFEEEGLHGIIVENYHGGTEDVIEVLKVIDTKMDVGINILPNEFIEAYEIANQFNVNFIQLDFIAGTYEGYGDNWKQLNVSKYISYRTKYPNILIFGGVWPKYYQPVKNSNLEEDLKDAMQLCDAVVVTGSGTGKETPLDKIKTFRQILGNFPLIIGAGLSVNNINQIQYADGAIVGSYFKPSGVTTAKVDRKLVKEFMNKLK